VFIRFWLFVLSLLGLITASLLAAWFCAAPLYLLSGMLWVWHDSSRPPSRVRSIYLTKGFPGKAVLLWPLLASMSIAERRQALRDPGRFRVVQFSALLGPTPQGGMPSGDQRFARWDDALNYARKLAAESGEKVTVSDTARFQWKRDHLHGRPSWKPVMYDVSPSGSVDRFRYPSFGVAREFLENLTSEELIQVCFLRAVEWELWPLFLSQSILPVLYLIIEWKLAWMLVCFLTVLFALFRYPVANIWVAVIGQNIVRLTRWPAILGIACYCFWKGRIFLGVLALATVPIITIVFWLTALVTPKSGTTRLQRIFLAQAGYDLDANGK